MKWLSEKKKKSNTYNIIALKTLQGYFYNKSPANLLNSLLSLVSKKIEPNIGCPLNLLQVTINPLLLKSNHTI